MEGKPKSQTRKGNTMRVEDMICLETELQQELDYLQKLEEERIGRELYEFFLILESEDEE